MSLQTCACGKPGLASKRDVRDHLATLPNGHRFCAIRCPCPGATLCHWFRAEKKSAAQFKNFLLKSDVRLSGNSQCPDCGNNGFTSEETAIRIGCNTSHRASVHVSCCPSGTWHWSTYTVTVGEVTEISKGKCLYGGMIGKLQFDEADCQRVALALGNISSYKCPHCRWWHVTSHPQFQLVGKR
jgi:hypothetical protein